MASHSPVWTLTIDPASLRNPVNFKKGAFRGINSTKNSTQRIANPGKYSIKRQRVYWTIFVKVYLTAKETKAEI